MPKLILASSSPRRQQILNDYQIPYEIILPEVEELTKRSPSETALYNAQIKAENIYQQHPLRFVLASDTVVAVGQEILGKPQDAKDAERILRLISGKKQQVISGFCILGPNYRVCDFDSTDITMRTMSDSEIFAYIDSGEPFGKAGAYAIQETGDQFVTSIHGSYHNVVGLPIEKILPHLQELQKKQVIDS